MGYCALVAVTTATELGVATPSIVPPWGGLPLGAALEAVSPLPPLQAAVTATSAAKISAVVSSAAERASLESLVM
jgi:hypothetical protein